MEGCKPLVVSKLIPGALADCPRTLPASDARALAMPAALLAALDPLAPLLLADVGRLT